MITSQEFKTLCKLIKELEDRFDSKLDGFGRKFIGLLQGFSVLDTDRQTMTSREVCEQYGVSMRTLCDMRKKGIIPFTKVSTRLSDPLCRRLGAYSRASGETKSGVIRSLIEKGYVKERISPDMMSAVRKLIGMATNLNQAAHQANAAGYRSAAADLTALAREIRSILNSITYGG